MIWWCSDCDGVFNDNAIKNKGNPYYAQCPNAKCNGTLIHLDEMMYPAIRLLNKKGWITNFCCSGHVYENFQQAYISFDHNIVKELPNIPKGFTQDGSTIRSEAEYNNDNPLHIYRNAIKIYKWAEQLPNNPDMY